MLKKDSIEYSLRTLTKDQRAIIIQILCGGSLKMLGVKPSDYCHICHDKLDPYELYQVCEWCEITTCPACIDYVSDSHMDEDRSICCDCFDPKIHTVIDDERG